MTPELLKIEPVISAIITVVVLSYLIGDNFLYRLFMHILVGVGAAYVVSVAIGEVLIGRLLEPLIADIATGSIEQYLEEAIGLVLVLLLLTKLFRRQAWLGNIAVGYMVGVGAAVAVAGAVVGTLAPQTVAATQPGDNALVFLFTLVSTLTTLATFTYSRIAWRGPVSWIGLLGRGVLSIAFGATFALVFIASASVLTTWTHDVIFDIGKLFPPPAP